MAAGASYFDVLRYDAERDTQPRRPMSPEKIAKLLDDDIERSKRELDKALKALERLP